MDSVIRPTQTADIDIVAREMRTRDVAEVYAASGRSASDALSASIESSALVWTARDDDAPYAIFGVTPYLPGTGSPWMLATDRLARHKRFVLTVTPTIVEAMLNRFPILINFVDARNRDSIIWLRKCARFDINGIEPHYGFERRPFFRFSKVLHV